MATLAATPTNPARSAAIKVSRRVLPFVSILYILSFLDPVNLGYAAADMSRDLHFTPAAFGLGAGLFFLPYCALEVPVTIAFARGRARYWLGGMSLLWGLAAALTAFVHSPHQFYAVRLLLGAAEAGGFPVMILYLNRWCGPSHRARAFAFLVASLPIANLIAAPLSAVLLRAHWLGMRGWQWLFIVEAAPTLVAGVLTFFLLPESPIAVAWLSREEAASLQEETNSAPNENHTSESARVPALVLTLAWFLFNVAVYGFTFWLPLVLKSLSRSSTAASALLAAVPFALALLTTIVVSRSSDLHRERHLHAGVPIAIFGIFLAFSAVVATAGARIAMLSLAGLGINSGTASFLGLCSRSVNHRMRALAIAIITSAGALGGFAGPLLMGALVERLHSFAVGLSCLALCGIVAGVLTIALKRFSHLVQDSQ